MLMMLLLLVLLFLSPLLAANCGGFVTGASFSQTALTFSCLCYQFRSEFVTFLNQTGNSTAHPDSHGPYTRAGGLRLRPFFFPFWI